MNRTRTRSNQSELLDQAKLPRADLEQNLSDLAWINRYLGSRSIVLGHLRRLLERAPGNELITVLDVATGGADIPRAVAGGRWPRPLRVIASDTHPQVLAVARSRTPATAGLILIRHDALWPPFSGQAVDFVLCSLALHHFDDDAVVRLLQALDRLARYGVIVHDLERSRTSYWVTQMTSRVLWSRHRLTRHDAPLSVLRAYTLPEIRRLVEKAGLSGYARLYRHWPFRVALVLDKTAGGGPG